MANKNNGFRDGKLEEKREKLRASITEEELQRIDMIRKNYDLKSGTISYRLAMQQDPLKIELRQAKMNIHKMLWNIRNVNNQLFRANLQLEEGKITEVVGETNLVMTKEELITWMEHMKWVQKGEALGIPTFLLKIRGLVSHVDFERKEIISEVQFDDYVKTVEKELKELGFDLFEK